MSTDDIDAVLQELAQTARYVQESGRLMRDAVQHLIETEQHLIETERRIEQVNAFMQTTIESIDRAINAALKAREPGA